MKIISRKEKIINNKIRLLKELYYLDLTESEFYEYLEDSRKIDTFVIKSFVDIINKKTCFNKDICVFFKKTEKKSLLFSLENTGVIFHNDLYKDNDINCQISLLFINDDETHKLLHELDWLIFIGEKDNMLSQYSKYYNNYDLLKEKLITTDCVLVEYTDLGCDGKILSFTNHNNSI